MPNSIGSRSLDLMEQNIISQIMSISFSLIKQSLFVNSKLFKVFIYKKQEFYKLQFLLYKI